MNKRRFIIISFLIGLIIGLLLGSLLFGEPNTNKENNNQQQTKAGEATMKPIESLRPETSQIPETSQFPENSLLPSSSQKYDGSLCPDSTQSSEVTQTPASRQPSTTQLVIGAQTDTMNPALSFGTTKGAQKTIEPQATVTNSPKAEITNSPQTTKRPVVQSKAPTKHPQSTQGATSTRIPQTTRSSSPTRTPQATRRPQTTVQPTNGSTQVVQQTQKPYVSVAPTRRPQTAVAPKNTSAKKLKVKGTKLVDSSDNVVVLKGVSSHGLSWFPEYMNKAAFTQLRDNWKVNTIRLAMYTAEYNGYCTGDETNRIRLENLIDDCINYTEDLGMYCIIDWHTLSDNNPNTYKQQSITFFNRMSKKYAKKTHVIYEICNEPNGGTSWNDVKSYAKDVIETIRRNDSDAIIIVGTPYWCQHIEDAVDSPLDYDNILYSMHFYAATHKYELRKKLKDAIDAGLPVIVSEFGVSEASGNGNINKDEANKWMKLLKDNSVGYCIWNLSNKSETCALIKNSVSKTSGFAYSELTEAGKWFYNYQNAR